MVRKCIAAKIANKYRAVVYTQKANTRQRIVVDFKHHNTLEEVQSYLKETYGVDKDKIELV